jgi:4-alpha-glucanotransferase
VQQRAAACKLPVLRDLSPTPAKSFTPELHAALLHLICGATSELVLLLLQDVLGRSERINVPGTVGPHNWTYRLPTPIEQMARDPQLKTLLIRLYEAIGASGRELPAPPQR